MRSILVPASLAAVLSMFACYGATGPVTPQFEVSLVNDASEAVHILTDDEDFATKNRIPPGAARSVIVSGTDEGAKIRFRAGRDGIADTSAICTVVRDRSPENRGLRVVVYHENAGVGSLVCVNWSF